ncbi:hypothetical protein [Rhodococcus opacus]|nr:hypothetical protein [Rhodococcus opacus]MDJ0415059.1 hypothetical protein [Rhodococcus opacus]
MVTSSAVTAYAPGALESRAGIDVEDALGGGFGDRRLLQGRGQLCVG